MIVQLPQPPVPPTGGAHPDDLPRLGPGKPGQPSLLLPPQPQQGGEGWHPTSDGVACRIYVLLLKDL